jgi:hypothetical protein
MQTERADTSIREVQVVADQIRWISSIHGGQEAASPPHIPRHLFRFEIFMSLSVCRQSWSLAGVATILTWRMLSSLWSRTDRPKSLHVRRQSRQRSRLRLAISSHSRCHGLGACPAMECSACELCLLEHMLESPVVLCDVQVRKCLEQSDHVCPRSSQVTGA